MTVVPFNKLILSPSIYHYLDLLLLKKKRVVLPVSENDYIHLTAAMAPVLHDKRILLIGNANIGSHFVSGYGSIYEKLTEKFSYTLSENFASILVFILCVNQVNAKYCQLVKKSTLHKNLEYESVVKNLEVAEYKQVNHVDGVRQFCLKGGIIDVYSPLYSGPVRICLYEGERSIKFYNIVSGISEEKVLDFIVLHKQGEEIKDFNIRAWCTTQKIPVLPLLKDLKEKIEVLDYYQVKRSQNFLSVTFLSDIYFSAYKYKNKILAPISYKKDVIREAVDSEYVFELGDYVCHEDFGVGLLQGFIMQHGKYQEESVQIQYKDGQILLAISGLHKLSVVSRETGFQPKIGSLSKQGFWQKTKKTISKSIDAHVGEIIELYEQKKDVYRAPFVFGGDLEKTFIEHFQYTDTPDQRRVWSEIKKDLEGERPMYRLLCGDVGFGKTEIAMRLAFRVVLNGGKVIILVPTSILVSQHYKVFCDRMNGFGVNVSMMTSAVGLKERQKLKISWLEGGVDVIIGTSSVLYDVDFIRVASVFVVDEEHRFGVKDKEVLVNRFANKDILYMSATPIPRSLNLSFTGIHSISTLASPPILRLPIQTFIVYYNQKVIKRAIDFELARGGQIFYLHNEIASINVVYNNLAKLLPYLSVVVAHSKISSLTLKKRILSFVNGEVNLLLCTSIIGSGIDIPNANTILINNAHLFGLGQLHQIRGRVGRGKKQAFAYLMIPKRVSITSKGEKRLKTISEHTELGSGYYIAKSDMQIRGGGLLFGYKQSGAFFKFGYEYYSKLVSKRVSKISKDDFVFCVDKFVYNVPFSCFIPEKYIASKSYRLTAYYRLSSLYDVNQIQKYADNLVEIYGKFPSAFQNLINMRIVSIYAGLLKLNSLTYKKNILFLVFDNKFKETSELLKLLKNKRLDKDVVEYFFKILKDATSLELIIDKDVILDCDYIKVLLERSPIYIAGLFLTASSPFKTVMLSA